VCLAKAYLKKWDGEPFLYDIAHMRQGDGQVELETLFGEEKVVKGNVVEVDFTASRILLDGNQEPVENP
jgi:predicted RNA-binding protein